MQLSVNSLNKVMSQQSGKLVLKSHTTFERSQNVHDRERVTSYYKALSKLVQRGNTQKYTLTNELINSMQSHAIKDKGFWKILKFNLKYARTFRKIRDWCGDKESTDQLYNMTFFNVLALIWTNIEEANLRGEFIYRLHLEINDAPLGTCFTGRVMRVLNACVGLLDDIHLNLSPLEHLNNRAVQLLKSKKPLESDIAFEQQYKTTMTKLLNEYNITDEATRQAYLDLDALVDARTYTVELAV